MKLSRDKKSENYNNANEDIKAIKSDMQNLVKSLSSLKDDGAQILMEESSHLLDVLSNMKDKAVKETQNGAQNLADHVCKSPLQSLAYSLGLGIILGFLLRK